MPTLQEELKHTADLVNNKKEKHIQTVVETNYNNITKKMRDAALMGRFDIAHSFDLIPEDKDRIIKEVIDLLLIENINVEKGLNGQKYLYKFKW